MRICHITTAHPATDVRIFHKECVSLAKAGHSVVLLVPNTLDSVLNGVVIKGVEVSFSGRLGRMTKVSWAIYKAAKREMAEAYHFHDPEFLPFAWLLARSGKRVTYDVHEDVPRQILSKHWIPAPMRKLVSAVFEWFENRVASKCHAIVAATPLIADRFKVINVNTVTVCNYPLLSELGLVEVDAKTGNDVCYIGSITAIRGAKEMVRAMKGVEANLHLAGAYSPADLRQQLIHLPEWAQVIEHGFVGRNEVWGIYAKCRVGLVTLHPAENYLESLPIKMFEYMLAGLAVVASDFPYWRSIVDQAGCGLCVNPLDPAAMGKAINHLLNNPDLCTKMGQAGREAVLAQFNWEQQEKALLQLYGQ